MQSREHLGCHVSGPQTCKELHCCDAHLLVVTISLLMLLRRESLGLRLMCHRRTRFRRRVPMVCRSLMLWLRCLPFGRSRGVECGLLLGAPYCWELSNRLCPFLWALAALRIRRGLWRRGQVGISFRQIPPFRRGLWEGTCLLTSIHLDHFTCVALG